MPEPLHDVTFRCPTCGAAVAVTVGSEPTACASCSTPIAADYGILDFVTERRSAGERLHYDGYYAARRRVAPTPLQLDTLGPRWLGRDAPHERRSARRRMGDLRAKDILQLCNGVGGGFREDDLTRRILAVGCLPWFERQALLSYMWPRATVCLFPSGLQPLTRRRAIARALVRLDERLSRLAPIRHQLIRLIWGFDKPRAPGQQAELRPGAGRRDIEGTRSGV